MIKFNLSAVVTVSIYTTVEAETLEEAIAISENRDIQAYQWGDKTQKDDVWISEEFDGLPYKIKENN